MPEMHFHLRWPDATQTRCYSPSLIIRERFAAGARYPLADFMHEIDDALNIASERVRARYGFACSAALDQLARLEAIAARFEGRGEVEMVGFEDSPAAPAPAPAGRSAPR